MPEPDARRTRAPCHTPLCAWRACAPGAAHLPQQGHHLLGPGGDVLDTHGAEQLHQGLHGIAGVDVVGPLGEEAALCRCLTVTQSARQYPPPCRHSLSTAAPGNSQEEKQVRGQGRTSTEGLAREALTRPDGSMSFPGPDGWVPEGQAELPSSGWGPSEPPPGDGEGQFQAQCPAASAQALPSARETPATPVQHSLRHCAPTQRAWPHGR